MKNITFSINDKVKELIESKKLSIKEVAEAMDLQPSSLSRMLGGDDLKVSTVIKIASILDVPVSVFFEEFDKDLPTAPQKIDAMYEKLNEMWQVIVKQKETPVSVAS
jgi:transcriptional regulator with XRE-family HTH domain